MLEGGEDPQYIARRVVRMAVEDIGLADPQGADAGARRLGGLRAPGLARRASSPSAQAMIYLATAPKSNAAYMAFGAAQARGQGSGSLMPPMHILNAPTRLMKELGYGAGYVYDPDTEEGFSGQDYFPDEMARQAILSTRSNAASSARSRSGSTTGTNSERRSRSE